MTVKLVCVLVCVEFVALLNLSYCIIVLNFIIVGYYTLYTFML